MATAMDIESLLDEVKREQEEKERAAAAVAAASTNADNSRNDARRQDRDRDRTRDRDRDYDRDRSRRYDRYDSNRYDRDRYDRGRGDRAYETYRESNGENSKSRLGSEDQDKDQELGEKEESRTHSNKGADTDEDHGDRYRRSSSLDRYRGDRGGRDDRGGRGDRGGRYDRGGRDDRGSRRDRGDYYSGGGRNRSRSPRRERSRDRDEQRPVRIRERSREPRRRRTPSPQMANDENRDKRTIFVTQIAARVEHRHLRQFFESVGEVIDAQIVKDRVSGRSKGVGYVEFKDESSVLKAIELTGRLLKNVPVIVQHTEAEKNRASRPTATGEGGAATSNNGAPFHRLFVGNIHFSVTEDDLKDVFSPFGAIEQITLQRDDKMATRSKGYGFVQFADPRDAKEALREMNSFELAGRQIRVGLGNDKFTPESTAQLLRNFPAQAANYQGSAFSGAGGRGAYAGGSGGAFDRTNGRDDRGVSGASALDDTDMSGIDYRHVDRHKLMTNLARDQVEVPVAASSQISKAKATVVEFPQPSTGIKIENAFDPEQEFKQFGPSWAKQLESEVKDECARKYGKVVHVAADPNTDGEIYVKFSDLNGSKKALQGLNGRGFNNRVIRASYVVDFVYESLYGAAIKKH
ncbi:unnamed protein product [Periconia digitata]|uniref:RRM domain-containing protein n=1 Tax=Periconia digitata TaxID=1303443 RepID=A0A9W4XLY9_9PLEO|nr:unnamed protein product [Periconia digitata]